MYTTVASGARCSITWRHAPHGDASRRSFSNTANALTRSGKSGSGRFAAAENRELRSAQMVRPKDGSSMLHPTVIISSSVSTAEPNLYPE